MSNIIDLKLFELVEKIKKKEISSTEVTKAFIYRSQKSKKLNSYITENFENALQKAKQFDEKPDFNKKLPGIPLAVKDLFCTKNIREDILKNSPDKNKDFFVVPKVVE